MSRNWVPGVRIVYRDFKVSRLWSPTPFPRSIIARMFKNRNLAILFFTLIVVMLGFGMIIPILPFLVEKFGGSGVAMGMLMAVFSLMQFIFSPFWGDLSDRYGRKPLLLMGTLVVCKSWIDG